MHIDDTGSGLLIVFRGGVAALKHLVLEVGDLKVVDEHLSRVIEFNSGFGPRVVRVFRPRWPNNEVEEHGGVHF